MKRLTKKQLATKAELFERAEAALAELEAARQDFEVFRDETYSDMDDYHCGRSERWQESEAGEAFYTWMSEWQSLELCDEVVANTEVEDFPESPNVHRSFVLLV